MVCRFARGVEGRVLDIPTGFDIFDTSLPVYLPGPVGMSYATNLRQAIDWYITSNPGSRIESMSTSCQTCAMG